MTPGIVLYNSNIVSTEQMYAILNLHYDIYTDKYLWATVYLLMDFKICIVLDHTGIHFLAFTLQQFYINMKPIVELNTLFFNNLNDIIMTHGVIESYSLWAVLDTTTLKFTNN